MSVHRAEEYAYDTRQLQILLAFSRKLLVQMLMREQIRFL
jgi:hypothetical protein